jgi:hypothetical protein
MRTSRVGGPIFVNTNLYLCPSKGTHIGYLGVNSLLLKKTHNIKLVY